MVKSLNNQEILNKLDEIIKTIHESNKLAMADISTLEEIVDIKIDEMFETAIDFIEKNGKITKIEYFDKNGILSSYTGNHLLRI